MVYGRKILAELKGDKIIWLVFILLLICSFLAVYSAAGILEYRYQNANIWTFLIKHSLILFVGGAIAFLFHRFDYQDFEKVANVVFFLTIPLLLYTMFFGNEINDARRWIDIPMIGVSLQTSDIAKISLVLYLSKILAFNQADIKEFKSGFVMVMLPVLIVCALILPSDFSTAAILFVVSIMLIFIGRVRISYILLLFVGALILIGAMYVINLYFPDATRFETLISRITGFLSEDTSDNVFAKIAIANGQWGGVGAGQSINKNFIAYPYADFIYAIIFEEYGLIGGFLVLLAYVILMWRVVILVTKSKKAFASFLILGLTLLIVVQALANMAVSLDLVPPTGLTLPLISHGGTSILFTCIAFGMILSVSHHIKMERLKAGVSSEIDIANA